MNKKIIYSLVGLALIFFVGSLIIFLKSSRDAKKEEPGIVTEDKSHKEVKEQAFLKIKVFFLTQESRLMRPVHYEIEDLPIRQDLYRKFIDILIKGEENYISPVPEGVKLRSVYFIERRQLLVLDFSDELISEFPGGSTAELEFIYFIVDNICYNFKEVKMVKFLISGNEYQELAGHIDMENPFYPDYSYIRDTME
jgi:spore germination protein GerM